MTGFKQIKTDKLGIVLQITEVATPDKKENRQWEVHDVERNRGFRVTLDGRALLEGAPKGAPAPTVDQLEGAIGLAIERFLLASPELVAGPLYEVRVSSQDLRDSARRAS
jgi:hypothetical protein